MKKLYRTTLTRENFFGIDSIQGYLEMAQWYHKDDLTFVCNKEDKDRHGSMLFILNQLENDGNINIEWADYTRHDNKDSLELQQISLTVQGHKLLDELQKKSKLGSLRKRAWDLFWVILTTICTTLVVLKLKGL